jgi:hypothetical protein
MAASWLHHHRDHALWRKQYWRRNRRLGAVLLIGLDSEADCLSSVCRDPRTSRWAPHASHLTTKSTTSWYRDRAWPNRIRGGNNCSSLLVEILIYLEIHNHVHIACEQSFDWLISCRSAGLAWTEEPTKKDKYLSSSQMLMNWIKSHLPNVQVNLLIPMYTHKNVYNRNRRSDVDWHLGSQHHQR